jgi:hypothetical protein
VKKTIAVILLLCASLHAETLYQADARAVGQANVSGFLDNASSGWLNPAQISLTTRPEVDFSCEFYFLGLSPAVYNGTMDYFNDLKLSFVYPLAKSRLGFGINRFNSRFFNDTRLRFTFSETFGPLSFGINLKYYRFSVIANDYTSLNPALNVGKDFSENIGVDAGVRLVILPDSLFATFAVSDLNQPDMGIVGANQLLFRATAGLGVKLGAFNAGTELEYSNGAISRFALGLETTVLSRTFPIRIGFNNSFLPSLGFTCYFRQKAPLIGLDYAANLFSDAQGGIGSHYFTLFMVF